MKKPEKCLVAEWVVAGIIVSEAYILTFGIHISERFSTTPIYMMGPGIGMFWTLMFLFSIMILLGSTQLLCFSDGENEGEQKERKE